jgi:hypothetical protein
MDGVGQDRVRPEAWQGEIFTIAKGPFERRMRGPTDPFFRAKMQPDAKCRNVVDKAGGLMTFWPFDFWLPSSMVEQLTLNQLVPGSSPGGATNFLFFASHFGSVAQQRLAGVAQW